MKRHFQCAEQSKSTSNLTKYCACHAKWISWLIRASYETSFPMRRASKVNLQPQQILRLPRKMNPMINLRHTWNVIYNARSKHMSATNLTKYCACHEICKFKTSAETPWIASANRKTIRRQSDDNPTIIRPWNRHLAPAASETLLVRSWKRFCIEKYNIFALRLSPKMSPNAAPGTKSHTPTSPNTAPCHAKCISWLIRVTYETSFRMRGASKVNLERHQILRLPRKMNLMIDPRHIWNVISNARSNQSQPRTSPNTAPATQNESHDWSASHMKRHFQCAEQAKSTSNLSKYCACHAKWIPWLICVTHETSFTMRGASTVSHQPHQILRLPRNL